MCCAGSRLYVQKKMFDRVVADVAQIASQMGPLVSREQIERVCSYVDIGRSQGATVVAGGGRAKESVYIAV